MTRPALTSLVVLVGLLAASCATGDTDTATSPPPGTPMTTPAPSQTVPASPTASPTPAEPAVQTVALSEPITHVHGLVVDAEGAVRAGTHEGVRVITEGGDVTAVGPVDDLMGMTGQPGTMRLISSGHPGRGSQFPNPVGLIRSDDGGQTWEPVSLTGEIDFHALATTGDDVVGFDGVTGILTSNDTGTTWQQGAPMAALSLAMIGDQVWATTPEGVMHSTDRAATFNPLPDAPTLWQISAGIDNSLWGVDIDGLAWRSTDGLTWTKHKRLPAIEAIAALDYDTAYAINDTALVILTA